MAKLDLKDTLNASLTKTKLYIDTELAKKANYSHGTHLTLGTGSGNAFRGDYGNTAYNHSQSAHAPSNAQKNSDITKAEIEAKLTGGITSHTHNYAPLAHASTSTSYGAASASNYGHAMASSTTPKANGTAAVGNETAKFARGDHVHPLQTTVSGNAGSATKLQNAKNIVIGNKTNSFDGTQNITYTLADIGAVSQTDVNNTIKNKFIVLTQAEYNALTTKTTDAIYFIKA